MERITVMIEEDDFVTQCIGVVDNNTFYGFVASLSYMIKDDHIVSIPMEDCKPDKDWNTIFQKEFPIHSIVSDDPKTDTRIKMIPENEVSSHILQELSEARKLYNSL